MKEVRESLFDFILVAISKSSLDQLISSLEEKFTGIFLCLKFKLILSVLFIA